jgi:cysteine desulfurase
MIYLDHNATTPPHPEVLDVIVRVWRDSFANPGSRHAAGRRARQVLESARESIASLVGAEPDELVFTSGGTESNNLAILGFTAGTPGTIALTTGEHPAVLEACRHRQNQGWRLAFLPVDSYGLLGPLPALTPDQASDLRLATVIFANNETGVIQDVQPLATLCRERGVPLHLDAVQAVGRIPVHFHQLGADSLAFAAHKFYGPRGIGGLLVRRGAKLAATEFGGHQEAGRRPGTEVVPLIAGMARALELFAAEQDQRIAHTRTLRDLLEQRLTALCPPVVVNGSRDRRLSNTANLAFPGADGEALLVALDLEGIACSLGSTCASGSAEPSPVLLAMQLPPEIWRSSVRFSIGIDNTPQEIEDAAQIIARVVTRLRAIAQPL